ncbi:hypothetical protein C0J52_08511 [Blattella germanica]|nr:hypothetical protein C0J52_08511 [Blattella germanica]
MFICLTQKHLVQKYLYLTPRTLDYIQNFPVYMTATLVPVVVYCSSESFRSEINRLFRNKREKRKLLPKESSETVMKELKCPVCMEYMVPPILKCENGNNVCIKCRQNLYICATRRQELTMKRKVSLENMTRIILKHNQKMSREELHSYFQCIIGEATGNPCTWKGPRTEIVRHVVEEHLDPLPEGNPNPFTRCNSKEATGVPCIWRGPRTEVMKHLQENHKDIFTETITKLSVCIQEFRPTYKYGKIILAFREMFSQQFQVHGTDFFFVVQFVGPEQKASEFKYKITFKFPADGEEIAFTRDTKSVNVSVEDIWQSGECIKLDYNIVKHFIDSENNLSFGLEIWRNEETKLNISLEKLASKVEFPCRYRKLGCSQRFSTEALNKHENNCRYRPHRCPLYNNSNILCQWMGLSMDVLYHIRNVHSEMAFNIASKRKVMRKDFKIDQPYEKILFLGDDIFREWYEVKDDDFYFLVQHLGPQGINFYYDFTLAMREGSGRIAVRQDVANSEDDFEINEMSTLDLTSDLLQELECPACMEYMTPPIFFCSNGHNVCNACKPRMESCPICRHAILKTRNVALEKLTAKVLYPCPNKKLGCNISIPFLGLEEHTKKCSYTPIECLLNRFLNNPCRWSGSKSEVKSHLLESHNDWLVDIVGRRSVKNNAFYFVVQYFGSKEEASKYKYEFLLRTRNGSESISMMNTTISSAVDIEDVYKSGECVKLYYETVERFLEGKNLKFNFKLNASSNPTQRFSALFSDE